MTHSMGNRLTTEQNYVIPSQLFLFGLEANERGVNWKRKLIGESFLAPYILDQARQVSI